MSTLKVKGPSQEALKIIQSKTPSPPQDESGHKADPNYPHTHPLGDVEEYIRTGALSQAWKIQRRGVRSVSIANNTHYISFVEFGWYTKKGLYVPGHFMLHRSLPEMREVFIRDNRDSLRLFLKRRPFSEGKPVSVDYSEYQKGISTAEEFEDVSTLVEFESDTGF